MANYISVGQLNNYLKRKFEVDPHLEHVYLKGEISNSKLHSRGHLYFSLKDETSVIGAIMFARDVSALNFDPKEGTKVFVEGKVTVYEATGKYQIIVNKMIPDGIGALYIAYEKLKKKLAEEGLFDKEHKRPIPKYPKRIGIVTAPTGAAIRDILSTIKRRYPICETILFPALVQGDTAKESIVKNITLAQDYDLDVLIVGRGVADLRAPTPTGAAEMAVPNMSDVFKNIDTLKIRLNENINNKINLYKKRLDALENSYILKNPMSIYEIKEQKLSAFIDKLNTNLKNKVKISQHEYENIIKSYILSNPLELISKKSKNYDLMLSKLELLNPLGILKKGYSVATINNKSITSYKKVKSGDILDVRVYDGIINTKVLDSKKLEKE